MHKIYEDKNEVWITKSLLGMVVSVWWKASHCRVWNHSFKIFNYYDNVLAEHSYLSLEDVNICYHLSCLISGYCL